LDQPLAFKNSIELSGCGFQITYPVFESRWASAKIDRRIPISAVRDRNSCGQPFEMTTLAIVSPVVFETLKVCVAHHSHVALMRALNDDNIAGIQIFTGMYEAHDSAPENRDRP
jgi:hypothetical protein